MLDSIESAGYHLIEKIGSGGIASVYKVLNFDKRIVALKILSCLEPEYIERFKREFLLLSNIRHPNIVQVYDFDNTSKAEPCFSMEYIEGKDFKSFSFEPDHQRFYSVLLQIFQTLEFLHYKGIIHGDLKPSNVLITSERDEKPKVKFTDFGFAEFGKTIDSAQWKGSLPYLAPEIIRGEEYNHQVDLYSLGVMIYEAITGNIPFKEKDLMDLAKAHLDQEPEFNKNIEIAETLKDIVLKLLKKDPIDRYYSAQEVMDDLKELIEISPEENDMILGKSLLSSAPFIGRYDELSVLKENLKKAKDGESRTILIQGEFGIGKTRLLKELKIFTQLNRDKIIWRDTLNTNKIPLSKLQKIVTESLPSLIVSDDFQHLSLEEVDLFLKWSNQLKENRILICLGLEDDYSLSGKENKALQIESNAESQLKENLCKITLNPLTMEETKRFISSSFNWKYGENKAGELIYEASGGSPFFINWVLTSLLEQGYLTRTNKLWQINLGGFQKIKLPEYYESQLKRNLSHLNPQSLSLLETASVSEKGLVIELLTQVSNLSREKIKECLGELLQQKFLKTPTNSSEKDLIFVNGLVRNWIYNHLDENKKKSLHEHWGKNIEKNYCSKLEEVFDELAFHYLKAGNNVHAFKYSFLAGDMAGKENDHSKAISHYENAISLFDTEIDKTGLSKIDLLKKLTEQYRISGDFDKGISFCSKGLELSKQESQSPEKIIEFHKELGLLNFNKGNYQKAIEILNEGLSLCNKTQDSKAKSDLNIKLGWTYKRKTEYAQAITHFHKVIELSGEVISKELGLALNGLGSVYSDLGELNKAFNLYQKALKIFVELGDENRIATVQMNLGLLVKSMGNPVDALDYFKQSLDFEERYQNVRRLSHLYNNLALTYGNLYDWDKSLEYHQKSYELKEKMEDEAELAITLDNLGIVYLKRGALKNSIEAHSSALRFFRNLKNKRDLAFSCYNLGKVYLLKGEWSKSKIYLEKSLKLREEFNDKIGKAESLCLLGRLNLERGDFPTASAQLKESLRLHDTERNPKKIIEVLLLLTELSLHQNNITEAELHLDYAEKLFKPIEDQALKGELKRIKSLFFIKKDKLEEGIKELLESAGIFRKLKMRYELGLTNLEIGKIKIEEENYKEAKAYLGESLNIFKHMEIPFRIKQCEDLMKGLSDYVQMEKQRTQVLYQITELLRNITDLDELLLKILDLAIKHLNAERAAIILYYPENDSLELKAARGIERETKEDALSISRRVIRNVLEADSPLIIQDARIDPEVSLYKSVITYNILSILCVPLNSKDKTLGTIYVDHRSLCGMFSREDSDFLKAFANLIAVALEKAQYYSHLNEEIFQLKKNLERTYTYPNIIGKSKKMQEVFHMVEKIADTKASVLLLGESGAGKELIANLIHHTSSRKNKSFLKVNCAALPESLLESELFGVEEKVATGVAMRDGKFKQADGGTIFFDEIGDMSLSTQAKVLRVLQEREFERVGGSKTIKVDIRVISATNKDLDDCMKKGTFRKDLFYRLNPVTIKIPPLRERKEDIPYLVEHFLDKFSEENKKPKTLVPVKIMNLLIDYPWPGNVRELANLMEKVVLFSEDGSFSREYLPSKAKSQREKRLLISKRSLSEVLDNVEKEMILSALDNNNWNQVRAALELEISEATLRRKMSKHKIKKQKNNTRQK